MGWGCRGILVKEKVENKSEKFICKIKFKVLNYYNIWYGIGVPGVPPDLGTSSSCPLRVRCLPLES